MIFLSPSDKRTVRPRTVFLCRKTHQPHFRRKNHDPLSGLCDRQHM